MGKTGVLCARVDCAVRLVLRTPQRLDEWSEDERHHSIRKRILRSSLHVIRAVENPANHRHALSYAIRWTRFLGDFRPLLTIRADRNGAQRCGDEACSHDCFQSMDGMSTEAERRGARAHEGECSTRIEVLDELLNGAIRPPAFSDEARCEFSEHGDVSGAKASKFAECRRLVGDQRLDECAHDIDADA